MPYSSLAEALNAALESFAQNEDVAALVKQQERDYQITLSGKLPPFNVTIPTDITKGRFLAIQNQITKSKQSMTQKLIYSKYLSSKSYQSILKKN